MVPVSTKLSSFDSYFLKVPDVHSFRTGEVEKQIHGDSACLMVFRGVGDNDLLPAKDLPAF